MIMATEKQVREPLARSSYKYVFIGIFFLSLAILLFELSLTRALSISLWYHFAFLVISMALLGFGMSGVFVRILPGVKRNDLTKTLVILSSIFSIAVLVCFFGLTKIPVEPYRIIERKHFLLMLLYYVVGIIPFFIGGLAVCTAVDRMSHSIHKLYFFDLLGAGAACLLVTRLYPSLGGERVTLMASVVGAVAAACFAMVGTRRQRLGACALFVAVCIVTVFGDHIYSVYIPKSKTLGQGMDKTQYPMGRVIATRWNAISRVDVWERGTSEGWAWGLSPRYEGTVAPITVILQDADSGTPVYSLPDGDVSKLQFLNYTPSSLAYQIKRNADVLIIGPGGGVDIATALANQAARKITGVELNPITVDLMSGLLSDYSGAIYLRPEVHIEVAEGRHFVRRTSQSYDIIQLSLVDTWAGTLSGAYSLSESYLYTLEAMRDYLTHLNGDGVLSICRLVLDPPRESLRLCTMAAHTLKRLGASDPGGHIAVIRSANLANVLVRRTPFPPDEIARIDTICALRGFDVLHLPGRELPNVFSSYLRSDDFGGFEQRYIYQIAPASDDKPFFFQYYRWKNLLSFLREARSAEGLWNRPAGHLVLFAVLAQSLLVLLCFVVVPLLVRARVGCSRTTSLSALAYFCLLGLGFMFVEIGMMQKFTLLLGYPMYSLSVVLASFLVFSGIGSLIGGWVRISSTIRTVLVPVLLAGLLIGYVRLLPHVFDMFLRTSLLSRVVLTIALLAPLGLLMGVPFPTGIALARRACPDLVPWGWAANACASVLGSVLSIVIALSHGFSAVILVAAGCYLATLCANRGLISAGMRSASGVGSNIE